MEGVEEFCFWQMMSNFPIETKCAIFKAYLEKISSDVDITNNLTEDGKRLLYSFLEINRSKHPDDVFVSVFGPVENLLPNPDVCNLCLETGLALINVGSIDKSEKYFKRLLEMIKTDKNFVKANFLRQFVDNLYNCPIRVTVYAI